MDHVQYFEEIHSTERTKLHNILNQLREKSTVFPIICILFSAIIRIQFENGVVTKTIHCKYRSENHTDYQTHNNNMPCKVFSVTTHLPCQTSK